MRISEWNITNTVSISSSVNSEIRLHFDNVDYLPENDRVRYTIHPEARKEVLKRLLELNHKIFEEEIGQGLHKPEDVRKFYAEKGREVPGEALLNKEVPMTKIKNKKKSSNGDGNLAKSLFY